MRIEIIAAVALLACLTAPVANADVSLPVQGTFDGEALRYIAFTLDFGPEETATTINVNVSITSDIDSSYTLRLFDLDGLIDDPDEFEDGTFLEEDSVDGSGDLSVSYATPSISGERRFLLTCDGEDGEWGFLGEIQANDVAGDILDSTTISGEEDVGTVPGLVHIRASYNGEGSAAIRLNLDIGSSPTPLRYITSIVGSGLSRVDYVAPEGTEISQVTTVGEAMRFAVLGAGDPVIIDQADGGSDNSIDETRYIETDDNYAGDVFLDIEVTTEDAGRVDIILLFPAATEIESTGELIIEGPSGTVIGSGFASGGLCSQNIGSRALPGMAIALFALYAACAAAHRIRRPGAFAPANDGKRSYSGV